MFGRATANSRGLPNTTDQSLSSQTNASFAISQFPLPSSLPPHIVFITVFTVVRHLSQYWATCIQSTPFYNSLRTTLILYPVYSQISQAGFFLITEALDTVIFIRATCPTHVILLIFFTLMIHGAACLLGQRVLLSTLCSNTINHVFCSECQRRDFSVV